MASPLACEKYWTDKATIEGAEKKYYECLAQLSLNGNPKPAVCPKAAPPQQQQKAPVAPQAKQPSPPASAAPAAQQEPAAADPAKVKKDKKRNKKNKKDASHSPDAAGGPAAAPVATPPEEPASPTVANAASAATTTEQNKKKAKKNKKNSQKAGGGSPPEVVAAPIPATNPKQLLTSDSSNKVVQQENAKNLKEKENLAHKLCDNITEELSKMGSFPAQCTLASEISKARQHIKNSLERMDGIAALAASPGAELLDRLSTIEKENEKMRTVIDGLNNLVIDLHARIKALEAGGAKPATPAAAAAKPAPAPKAAPAAADDDDDDVDLFGSEDEDEDKAAAELREKRLAEYAAKKSKKPALIAKSNVILDIKPWDDETDMKQMELEVRKITMDGLLLGASKLVPLAYGIHKLQLSCVIEDDKVSVDELQEKIEQIEDFVQSVDIAAFNKF